MKTVIAGGRDFTLDAQHFAWLDGFLSTVGITEVVSGGASGVDASGERWASIRNIPMKRFPADWATHGKAAGPWRNRQMAEYADLVLLFPGGRGTESMKREAEKANTPVFEWKPTPSTD